MGWFDDVVDFVGDAADAVVGVAEGVVGGVADAVSEIPLVGDVAEMAAPFAGIIGTAIGGPVGGAIGGVVGGAFGDDGGAGGGGMFSFVDDAIGAIGGGLPGGLGDIAGDLLGGGSLIDAAGSMLTGGLGSLGDLGGLADAAGGLLGGDLGGLASAAQSAIGGLGLGSLGSAVAGVVGDCMPGTSDAGGWLGNLGEQLGGLGGGMPFGGCGTFPTPDLTGPIGQAGGNWLENLGQQVGQVAEQIGGNGGGMFGHLLDRFDDLPTDIIDFDTVLQPGATSGEPTDILGAGQSSLDDLIGQLPGVGEGAGSVQEKLQSLVENGNLGEALGNLSSNELTQIVSHLVNPVPSAIDDVTGAAGAATSGLADAGSDAVGSGADDLGLDPVTAAVTPGDSAPGAVDMPTPGAGEAGVDDLSIEMPGVDLGAPEGPGAVEMPAPPEPEPVQSDFSQAIAQADAVEESFDSMFEGLE